MKCAQFTLSNAPDLVPMVHALCLSVPPDPKVREWCSDFAVLISPSQELTNRDSPLVGC